MGFILEKIEEAIKELLIGWIESNMTNMFTDVNDKVGTIAAEVGKTPSSWDSSIYQMIRGLSENVIVPIAGMALPPSRRSIWCSPSMRKSCLPILKGIIAKLSLRICFYRV